METIRRYWAQSAYGLAIVATSAFLIIHFIPDSFWPNNWSSKLPLWQNDLLVAAFAACVSILLVMRSDLLQVLNINIEKGSTQYKTMREARPEILENLLLQTKRKSHGDVIIIGGRLRSITEIFREYEDKVKELDKNEYSGCVITIFYLSPVFLGTWSLPGDVTQEDKKEEYVSVASSVRANIDVLNTMFSSDLMKEKNIVLNLVEYNEYPTLYAYIFGDETLVWGGYHWEKAKSDVIGPSYPCVKLTKSAFQFEPIRKWLLNRTSLLQAQNNMNSS